MALILTLRKGHSVYVGETRVVCSDVRSPYDFDLRVGDRFFNKINDQKWVTIMENVKVRAGIPENEHGKFVRVMFDAPKKIRISRTNLDVGRNSLADAFK